MKSALIAGEIAELRFDIEVKKRDLMLSLPASNALPYDRLVDNGKKIFRVQVKTTAALHKRGCYIVNLYRRSDNKAPRKFYKPEEVDVFAVYVECINEWYIVPYAEAKASIMINPNNDRYAEFKENWNILQQK
jgi:hypothetical protein